MKNKKLIFIGIGVLLLIILIVVGILLFTNKKSKKEYYYCEKVLKNEEHVSTYAKQKIHYNSKKVITKFETKILYKTDVDDIYNNIIKLLKLTKVEYTDNYKKNGEVYYYLEPDNGLLGSDVAKVINNMEGYKCELKEEK